jgi:hypothetical protein
MHRLPRLAAAGVVLVLAACAKKEAPRDTTTAMAPPPAPAPAAPAPTVALADLAGKWKITTTPVDGKDSSKTTATLIATANTSGWALELPSGQKVPLQVSVSADTVKTKSEV